MRNVYKYKFMQMHKQMDTWTQASTDKYTYTETYTCKHTHTQLYRKFRKRKEYSIAKEFQGIAYCCYYCKQLVRKEVYFIITHDTKVLTNVYHTRKIFPLYVILKSSLLWIPNIHHEIKIHSGEAIWMKLIQQIIGLYIVILIFLCLNNLHIFLYLKEHA